MTELPWWKKICIWIWPCGRAPVDEPPETAAEEFSRDVKAASDLLAFLIREGLAPIRDQIIDDIEAARAIAATGTPAKEDHARLLKAYRDLVLVPRITIVSARMPPITFWGCDSPWPGLLIWAGIVPSILGLLAIGGWHVLGHSVRSLWLWPIAYFFLAVLTITGIYVFSGTVTNNKLNQIIRFCYVFTGIALLGSLLPFVLPDPFRNTDMASRAPIGVLQGCVKPPSKDAEKDYPREVLCDHASVQWVANFGGVVKRSADDKTVTGEINGGLVVPLYVVVLALFGGAISMTRRVPEYQRRALDSHDVLTNAEARENLVFQIMQVFTAPLIAVTTYYIILPDTPLKSVVLGFGSGFASEPILLMIRALVDKLKPATGAQQAPANGSAVSVTMIPPSATVPPGTSVQFAATVSGSPNTQLLWSLDPPDASAGTISQNGFYVAPTAPPTKGVTITARSAADSAKFATASVKVEPIVTVRPAAETLGAGKDRQFTAEVLGLSGPGVDWSIEPTTEGQISNAGLYTAPAAVAATKTVTVVARSKVDTTRFGSAKVTLKP
jgi:hypothetical protein